MRWVSSSILSTRQGGDAEARDATGCCRYAELDGLAQARLRYGGHDTPWTRPVRARVVSGSRVPESFVGRGPDGDSLPTPRR